jgi:DNA ligase-1
MVLFKYLLEYNNKLKTISSRNGKINMIMQVLDKLSEKEAVPGVYFVMGRIRQGKMNLTWHALDTLVRTEYKKGKPMSLLFIDQYLEKSHKLKGKDKVRALIPMVSHLSLAERKYFVSLVINEAHQGAGEGLVKTAIARKFGLDHEEMEQIYLQNPDLGSLFENLKRQGKNMIKSHGIRIFRPVKPMLAQTGHSISELAGELDELILEYKLDGVRVQIHRDNDKIKIYSRNLKDITEHFPELIALAKTIPVKRFIIDGEAISINDKGYPLPFQVLAKRTTRKKDIRTMMDQIPVVPKFFDIIYLDNEDLTDKRYIERQAVLNDLIVDKNHLVENRRPVNKSDSKDFFNASIESGNEGIVAKSAESTYRPGKRGKFWIKIKKVHTMDCIVLAAEWGHGRRQGFLSNLHLGILDETKTKYLMVGKTFKGLTDQMLKWLTEKLIEIKVHEDAWTVYVRPQVIVEIAFNEVQKSPKYDSGYALRFARVKSIRSDKTPDQVNTIIDLVGLRR